MHKRHIAVIEAASHGLLNREIAEELNYSPRTVEGLVEQARVWLEARNRPHLVACAIKLGLIPTLDPAALMLLSSREHELAQAIARGRTATLAASELAISPHTATTHIRHAKHVTGCRSSTALAALVASAERHCDSDVESAGGGAVLPNEAREGYRMLLALLQEGRVDEAIRRLVLTVSESEPLR